MSFTQGRQVLTLLTPHYKERQGKIFRWGSQSSHGSEADQAAHPAVLPTEGRPKTTSSQAQVQRLVLSELQEENSCQKKDTAQDLLQRLRFLPDLSQVSHEVPVLSFHLLSEASGGDTEQDKKPWQHARLAGCDLQDHLGNCAGHHFLGKTPVPQTKETFKLVSRRCGRKWVQQLMDMSTLTPWDV